MSKSKFDPQYAEGMWPCVVLNGGIGEDVDNNGKPTGKLKARVNIKFTDGPDAGKMASYEDELNAKSSLYISRSLSNIGCTKATLTGDLTNAATDIEAWVKKTGGTTTAEVRHIELTKGKKYDEWMDAGCPGGRPPIWAKVNSLGRGPRPLVKPSNDALSDAAEQMRRAMEADSSAPPADDAPPPNDSDIPF
jgi:hypothetical protein